MKRSVLFLMILATLVGGAAVAQPTVVIERPKGGSARQEGIVRVQLSIQLFIAGPTDESAEADKARERARRVIYEMAAKECEMMRQVVASDCRLEMVNVNLNRQRNPQAPQTEGYQVGGSMTYQITLK